LDTDSSFLPSALVFSAFFLLFIYLSLAEHAAAVGTSSIVTRSSRGLGLVISSGKYACIIAISVSGLALALSVSISGWWTAILALALLIVFIVVNWLTNLFAAKNPVKARACLGPLQRTAFSSPDRRSGNGYSTTPFNGGADEPTDEEQWELEEQVIAAAESGGIDARDREMLRSILRLDVSTVREIMMPRLDMVTVDLTSSLREVAATMSQSGHSRLPVFEESIDSIVGIVHSRDLLSILGRGEGDRSLLETMRPAFFIPEFKRLDDLLQELQEKGIQMAIVVDEYGGTEGLVTMEDLLEEIVGEIEDEFSRDQEPEVVRYPDGSALVDAGVTTDEVRALFGAVLDRTDIDTVGGYVYRFLGRIPQAGDIVVTDKLRIEVVSILGRRLRKLRINPIAGEAAAQKAS